MTPDAPIEAPPAAELRHVTCGYGGTGVSPPGALGVVPCFDVVARRSLDGLRVVDLALLDVLGATVARADPPIELHVSLPGRDRDHNPNRRPFDGAVAAGATVRLCATAGVTLPPGARADTLGYRATLVTSGDASAGSLVVAGPLDSPWPTAGPAGP